MITLRRRRLIILRGISKYSEREIQSLSPALVIPRVTRYGSLNDIIRLFIIFSSDTIYDVVSKDRELDITEKTFLKYICINGTSL